MSKLTFGWSSSQVVGTYLRHPFSAGANLRLEGGGGAIFTEI
jgi:hypothetical protein